MLENQQAQMRQIEGIKKQAEKDREAQETEKRRQEREHQRQEAERIEKERHESGAISYLQDQRCATCEYFDCSRHIDGEPPIRPELKATSGFCKANTDRTGEISPAACCSKWAKWSAIDPFEETYKEKYKEYKEKLEAEIAQREKERAELKKKQAKKNIIILLIIAVAVVAIAFLIVFASGAEKRALNKEKKILNHAISENGANNTYIKSNEQSGDSYEYSLSSEPSYRFAYDDEYEASVTIKSGDTELLCTVTFNYGSFDETADYYAEIRIKENQICYIKFEGVRCAVVCPELNMPSEIKIVGYSKSWDYSVNPNDYSSDLWEMIRATVSLTQSTINSWNESLNLWE